MVTIKLSQSDASNDSKLIFDELKKHNNQFQPQVNYQPITLRAENDDGEFLGGIDGFIAWDMFEISNMVVLEKNKGTGTILIQELETFLNSKNITKITAWTLDFQAPRFYKKFGFKEFAVIPNFAGNHACHHFIKRL